MKSEETQDISESENQNNPRNPTEIPEPLPRYGQLNPPPGPINPQIRMDLAREPHQAVHQAKPSLPWSVPPVHLQGVVQ